MTEIKVILGPTSSGKTSLALNLCKKFNGEIISADSRQVYKFMDIGTGKIPLGLNKNIIKNPDHYLIDGVKIWGYDLVEPDIDYSAFEFGGYFNKVAQTISNSGKNIFLVGGSGFYIDVVTGRVRLNNPGSDPKLRGDLQKLTNEELLKKLESINPLIFNKIDKENRHRIMRALEVELLKNNKISKSDKENKNEKNSQIIKNDKNSPNAKITEIHKFKFIGLRSNREYLYQKADNWVESIWENGLEQETQELLNKGYINSPRMRGLIYKQAVLYLADSVTKPLAIQKCKYELHAYIRRQQTWFARNDEIDWYEIDSKNLQTEIEKKYII